MPVWLVEIFAHKELNLLFWAVALMASPLWVLMLAAPANPAVRRLAHPFFLPPLLSLVWFYLVYLLFDITGPPGFDVAQAGYRAAKSASRSPFFFLAAWCQIQVLNLFLGCVVLREANARKIHAPVELLLCWAAGPAGLVTFSLRLLVTRR